MGSFVIKGLAALLLAGIVLAGYFVPPMIWTRDSAVIAILRGTNAYGIVTGNSRVPCRGPNKALYVFGYTIAISFPDRPSGSGSICWDVVNSRWDWRLDPPYDHVSSDRPPEARGAGSLTNMRRAREETERLSQ